MKKHLLIIPIIALLFSGCSKRIGNMTALSTNSINGLNTQVSSDNRVKGKSCVTRVVIFPFGAFRDKLEKATDDAIENGRSEGLRGDLIVNARVYSHYWYIPFLYGRNCMVVKGDLVQFSDSIK
ncbi:MAG: hypothetical protein JJV95_02890 [Sulfurospirillum sp.]|nr:hypothetical protein [Sulfurospirillum sp.]MBL0702917.1 hypothetical protein [Sulfurospirillum sp.]